MNFGKNKKNVEPEEVQNQDVEEEIEVENQESKENEPEEKGDNPVFDIIEKLNKENDDLKTQVNDYKTSWQRERADFDNFKKRSAVERQELYKIVAEDTVAKFLDVVDNLERALDMGRKAENFEALISGVDMVHKQMLDVMSALGVTQIDAIGKEFDPNFHEAVQTEVKDDVPEGTILAEFRKGYMGSSRAVRASMVKVSKQS